MNFLFNLKNDQLLLSDDVKTKPFVPVWIVKFSLLNIHKEKRGL